MTDPKPMPLKRSQPNSNVQHRETIYAERRQKGRRDCKRKKKIENPGRMRQVEETVADYEGAGVQELLCFPFY